MLLPDSTMLQHVLCASSQNPAALGQFSVFSDVAFSQDYQGLLVHDLNLRCRWEQNGFRTRLLENQLKLHKTFRMHVQNEIKNSRIESLNINNSYLLDQCRDFRLNQQAPSPNLHFVVDGRNCLIVNTPRYLSVPLNEISLSIVSPHENFRL